MDVPELDLTQFTVVEAAPGYWRATFDHPPPGAADRWPRPTPLSRSPNGPDTR